MSDAFKKFKNCMIHAALDIFLFVYDLYDPKLIIPLLSIDLLSASVFTVIILHNHNE